MHVHALLTALVTVTVNAVHLAAIRSYESPSEAGYRLNALPRARRIVLVHIDKVRESPLRHERMIGRKIHPAKIPVIPALLASVTF